MSAAKLRKFGRGSAIVATTALVMTSFGPAAFAAWDDSPQVAGPDTVNPAATGVGIVDTDKAKAQTQGATLVQPGQDAQALDDVRLVLPNSFKKGDVVDLRLFDRSATETNNGRGNAGPSTKMEFSADVTTEVAGPSDDSTVVGIKNVANGTDKTNTETSVDNPWAAGSATGIQATKPGVTPAFDVSRVASTGSAYKDTIRLTVNTDPSTGDPSAKWVVTVKGLKVDLGANVTPGELRLVPFAYNTDNNKLVAAPTVFSGNREAGETAGVATLRAISIYTVPGYVSPVTFEAGSPNIIADAGAQSIGDLLIKETHPASLLSGTYTVNIDGATLANADASSIKAAIENGGTNEAITVTGVSTDKKSFTFRLASADATKMSNLKFSGLMLTSKTAGKLTFRLSGGSVDQYLADPAGTSQAIVNDGKVIFPSDDAFLGQNASPIRVAPLAPITPTNVNVAGGLSTGDYTVVADGTAFRLNDASGDTVARSLDGQAWTAAAPFTQAPSVTRALVPGEVIEVRGTTATTTASSAAAGTVALSAAVPTAALPDGTYTVRRLADNTWALLSSTGTTLATAPAGANAVFPISGQTLTVTGAVDGQTLTVVAASDGTAATVATADITATSVPTAPTAPTGATFSPAAAAGQATTLTVPTQGTYTVRTSQAGSGTGYQLIALGGTTVVANSTDGVVFTFAAPYAGSVDLNGASANTAPVVTDGATVEFGGTVAATTRSPQTPTATMSATAPLPTGTYTVQRAANGAWTIQNGAGATLADGNTAGTAFTLRAPLAGAVVFDGPVIPGSTFTVSAAAITEHINQQDIVAPLDAVTQLGTVSAGISSIGGTNRFGTAARIADEFKRDMGAKALDTAIVVNGMQASDALSASFLSQREGAPILLTAPGQLPSETVEALRKLGVRKVYIVGGKSAVGAKVFDALKNQDAYMWDESAGGLKPRGDKLEVVQLGGDNRYETNWRVNTYAASQTAAAAPVGKIAVGYGEALKTTAMIARSSTSNDFVDALSASVLSAGRTGGLQTGDVRKVFTGTGVTLPGWPTADLTYAPVGTFNLVTNGTVNEIRQGTTRVGVWTASTLTFDDPRVSAITTNADADAGDSFTIAVDSRNVYGYDNNAPKVNALPVILTTPGSLVPQAKAQMSALHLEHALLIGDDSALAPKVNDDVAAAGLTSWRIGGKDRWETAANVNRFAMAPETAAKKGDVPGLGFNGSRRYSNADGTGLLDGGMNAYLANGMRFPDALVAGPWISRNRDAMLMTLANELPKPTGEFLAEKAPEIDAVAGLGQGDVVSSKVLAEANRIASTK